MGKKIKTLKDLLEFTGLLSLPRKPLEIAQVVNDIADRNGNFSILAGKARVPRGCQEGKNLV